MQHENGPVSNQSERATRIGGALRPTAHCRLLAYRFQMEFVPKPPPGISRRSSGGIPAEGKPKEEEALPPLAQGKKGKAASSAFPGHKPPT